MAARWWRKGNPSLTRNDTGWRGNNTTSTYIREEAAVRQHRELCRTTCKSPTKREVLFF